METIAVFEAKSRLSEILCAGDVATALLARQNLINRCLLARAAAPVDDFDVMAAIEEGRD